MEHASLAARISRSTAAIRSPRRWAFTPSRPCAGCSPPRSRPPAPWAPRVRRHVALLLRTGLPAAW